jgi:hypothetical protein
MAAKYVRLMNVFDRARHGFTTAREWNESWLSAQMTSTGDSSASAPAVDHVPGHRHRLGAMDRSQKQRQKAARLEAMRRP